MIGKIYNKFSNIFLKKDFFTFLIIGVINTFNGSVLSLFYSSFFQVNVSFVFGYVTSIFISYILNSVFTFHEKLNIKKFINFFIACMPNFVVQLTSVYIIFNILNYDKIIAYLLAAIIGVPVTFLLLKFYTFKKTSN